MDGMIDEAELARRFLSAIYRISPKLELKLPQKEFPRDALLAALRMVKSHARVQRDADWLKALDDGTGSKIAYYHPLQYATMIKRHWERARRRQENTNDH